MESERVEGRGRHCQVGSEFRGRIAAGNSISRRCRKMETCEGLVKQEKSELDLRKAGMKVGEFTSKGAGRRKDKAKKGEKERRKALIPGKSF